MVDNESVVRKFGTLVRGTIVNRTYGTSKNLCSYLFLVTIGGPVYYGPP